MELLRALFVVGLFAVVSAQNGCDSPALVSILNNGLLNATISSPNYHADPAEHYPNNLKCRWTLEVPAWKNILLTFSPSMNLEGPEDGANCTYDWVAVFPRDHPANATLCTKENIIAGPFCPEGQPPPSQFIVHMNRAIVEFCTDGNGRRRGFELTFEATDKEPSTFPITAAPVTTVLPTFTPPPIVCGGERTLTFVGDVSGSDYYITTPSHPEDYPPMLNCTWKITGPIGERLSFTAEVFSLEEDPDICSFDWLELKDTTDSTNFVNLGKFCGREGPKYVASISNKVEVNFISDPASSGSGFKLRIHRSRCPNPRGICPNNGYEEICLSPEQVCDGNNDCPDGADENCPTGCGVQPIKPLLSTKNGGKIVGGIEAIPHSWPWQVAMYRSNGRKLCGGTIIDNHWILTAAHCCDYDMTSNSTDRYNIRVGEHDLTSNYEKNARRYNLARIVSHPQYGTSPVTHHDICLLKTELPILFNDHVYPACLSPAKETPAGTDCYVTGWGSTSEWRNFDSNEFSDQPNEFATKHGQTIGKKNVEKSTVRADQDRLNQVDLKLVGHVWCNLAYGGRITADMICGYNLGKDSCQGDSGGPLVCPSQSDPNTFELVGVVSWGAGCARPGLPGVYAKTSFFIDWISGVIMNDRLFY